MQKIGKRFWEIDALRGAAVCAMIAFHALFDLNYFASYTFNLGSGVGWWLGRATAGAFIFLAGIGLAISYSRTLESGFGAVAKKFILRGLKTFLLGLVVTAATYAFLANKGTIWFGVLHFIGVGVILSLLFVWNKWLVLAGGVASIALGLALENIVVQTPYFVLLGLKYPGFYSFDYFPLFPWLGVLLLGVFTGKSLYSGGERKYAKPAGESNPATKAFAFLGRHSLAIYFLHQPLLIALILLLKSSP